MPRLSALVVVATLLSPAPLLSQVSTRQLKEARDPAFEVGGGAEFGILKSDEASRVLALMATAHHPFEGTMAGVRLTGWFLHHQQDMGGSPNGTNVRTIRVLAFTAAVDLTIPATTSVFVEPQIGFGRAPYIHERWETGGMPSGGRDQSWAVTGGLSLRAKHLVVGQHLIALTHTQASRFEFYPVTVSWRF